MIGSNFPTLSILLLSVWAKTAQSFQCYTGDGRVMRRKTCPTLGDMKFTDLCFKTYGESHKPKSIKGVLAVIISCLRKTFSQSLQFCLLLCSQLLGYNKTINIIDGLLQQLNLFALALRLYLLLLTTYRTIYRSCQDTVAGQMSGTAGQIFFC